MIILDHANATIQETVRRWMDSEKQALLDAKLVDFDGVHYRISAETSSSLTCSMSMRCFKELCAYGAKEHLKAVYGDWYDDGNEESGYDMTLRIKDPNSSRDRILEILPLLKRNAMAAPFYAAFQAASRNESSSLMCIPYRGTDEALYVQARPDRVTVMFSTVFHEEADRVYAKVFLQEFVDARKSPALQNAPQVLYTHKEPPLELRGVIPELQSDSDNTGYVTFVLFPRHYKEGDVREQAISQIQLFRDYLHYHIKCSKAYMHSRMRARVESFLKVLNRAKIEKETSEKKTASGRTFVRK